MNLLNMLVKYLLIMFVFYASSSSAQSYPDLLSELALQRQQLFSSPSAAPAALDELFFEQIYNRIMPQWYGTPWAFDGTTTRPGRGAIACGYFVSTVLKHAGVNVERVRLAQQASEIIIKRLVKAENIRRYRRMALVDFVADVKKWGRGIYVVGLDIHAGFLVHDGAGLYFIHASYQRPLQVVKEPALRARILEQSRYRVVGKLSSDERLLRRWRHGTRIRTLNGVR